MANCDAILTDGNRRLLFYHQHAFLDNASVRKNVDTAFGEEGLEFIEVAEDSVSLKDAVASYLFNSQLVSPLESEGTTLIVPSECHEITAVKYYLDELESNNTGIDRVIYFDLHQSMNNGGGPACLRLRVVMSEAQIEATRARVFLDDDLYGELKGWIVKHYRESLAPSDLKDASLLNECRIALDDLTSILNLGSIYDFQK